jgi:hypothetical protein
MSNRFFFKTFTITGLVSLSCLSWNAQAQLATGIEASTSQYESADRVSGQSVSDSRGTISGFRAYFGSQRTWNTLGWIADLDYKTGNVDYFSRASNGASVAALQTVRLVKVGLTLHVPIITQEQSGLALAPRLGYRAHARNVDGTLLVNAFNESYQEGVAGLAFIAHTETLDGHGAKASIELERSFGGRLQSEASATSLAQDFRSKGTWRPQFEFMAWYRLRPGHSVSLRARFEDVSIGASDLNNATTSSSLASSANAGSGLITTSQKIRTGTVSAGWNYRF